MTLFKRVFASHTNAETVTPTPGAPADEPEAEIAFDDAFVTGMGMGAGEPPEDAPLTYSEEPLPLDEAATSEQPFYHDLTGAAPQEPSMADRAAQAQRDIETSQSRMAAEQVERRADLGRAPKPVEDRDAAAPVSPPAAPPSPPDQSADATVPAAAPRPGRGARRVRTRMLGFDQGLDAATDPFAKQEPGGNAPAKTFPVGWMIVIDGPGKGHSFAMFNGVSTIGRGADQTVVLDFGDTSISREKHAAVAYDDEQNSFFLGHGGKSNIVRLNGRPVLSTEDLSHGDTIRIGETTLRFVALCGTEFSWGASGNDDL